ncbi:Divalent metal cation transporter MntH [Xylella fastidiosa 9a5c] [Rhizoctonia solani]|uniref:Divalent metal cation transporter MntH [Xylella fastidiosa 9a5c] n=1 Tax=Rhizoctonia solani TaxID=456999 RepID=A0A0K6G1S0_9AGAM|nr:Divalent metal cation transporter MntH [Xylella fastidiosa 9a5c] [Rhizoctonia solani]
MSNDQIRMQQIEADALSRLPSQSQPGLEQTNNKDAQTITDPSPNPTRMEKLRANTKIGKDFLVVHITRHVGPGVLASIAYFDPGNWSVDLQAGSQYGYKLLSVVLLAGLGAILLQTMAARLGCVTGRDLAQHCRLLLHSRPKHKLWFRRALLYPMYVMCEVGIIATDLAELLGSAIGLSLLIPAIPLWAGVLITSIDVIFVLAMAPTSSGRPVRAFEWLLMTLVFIVFVVFIILIRKIDPYWPDVFNGYLPSKTIFQPGALYTSIGILGATVMPHALFLGSSLATLDRVSRPPAIIETLPVDEQKRTYTFWQQFGRAKRALFWVQRSPANRSPIMNNGSLPIEAATGLQVPDTAETEELNRPASRPSQGSSRVAAQASDVNLNHEENKVEPQTHAQAGPGRQNNTLDFIKAHLSHAIIDIVMSLLGFAVSINSAILILGAAAFYYGGDGQVLDAGLFDAHDLIRDKIGRPAAFLFALALLCSGQSASITATLAGQIVSEGFIEWRISPLARRTITRLIGLVPSMIVAVSVGRQGIDTLLVASQVALSIVLPFVIFPLVYLASSDAVMSVPTPDGGTKSYKNHWITMSFGYLLFIIVVLANSYVIVTLAMGDE